MTNKLTISFSKFEYDFLTSLGIPLDQIRKDVKARILKEYNIPKDTSRSIEVYRNGQGLSYIASDKELQDEFYKIGNTQATFDSDVAHNKIILHFQPHFYEREKELFKDPSIKEKLIENRVKYLFKKREELNPRELLRGFKISGIHYGYSKHSYCWVKAFIQRYNIKSIYDPCGGWGHRLLGAKDIKYIYNDTDTRTVEGVRKIADFFKLENKVFYNRDASSFTPEETYEAVFTCPPYFDQEVYGGEKSSTKVYPIYQDWLNVWWRNVIKRCKKPEVKYFCFIISNKYLKDMVSICLQEELKIIEKIPVGNPSKVGHFYRKQTGTKEKKAETLVIAGVPKC